MTILRVVPSQIHLWLSWLQRFTSIQSDRTGYGKNSNKTKKRMVKHETFLGQKHTWTFMFNGGWMWHLNKTQTYALSVRKDSPLEDWNSKEALTFNFPHTVPSRLRIQIFSVYPLWLRSIWIWKQTTIGTLPGRSSKIDSNCVYSFHEAMDYRT